MKRALSIVSDLHLGVLPALDDFVLDERFALLLSWLTSQHYDECELILLGDTFDMWQAVNEEELLSDEIPEESKRPSSVEAEKLRIDRIRERHARCFTAIAQFCQNSGHHATLVVGNHDHALANPEIKARVWKAFDGVPSLEVELAADREDMRLYAEHGNQFAGANKYAHFDVWNPERECIGYYFVRLFWNWLEYNLPSETSTSSEWMRFWDEVRKHPRLLPRAFKRFCRYVKTVVLGAIHSGGFTDKRDVASQLTLTPPGSPTLLLSGTRGPNLFTDDPVLEQAFREAYHQDEEMRETVDAILRSQGRDRQVPQPESPSSDVKGLDRGVRAPQDIEWAESLFTDGGILGKRLSSGTYDTVIFGHTHDAGEAELSNGARRINTGTWAVGPKDDVPVALATLTDPLICEAQVLEILGRGDHSAAS